MLVARVDWIALSKKVMESQREPADMLAEPLGRFMVLYFDNAHDFHEARKLDRKRLRSLR